MIILCYHKIQTTSNFELQIKFLKKYFKPISISDFIYKVENSIYFEWNEVLITFDDGDISLHTNALPILHQYQVPAVAFIITSLINTNTPFWWDEVLHYTGNENEVRRLKRICNNERLAYLKALRESAKEKMFYEQLTLNKLKDLEDGDVAIASHTHSHPLLDQCDDETVYYELKTSREMLKQWGFPFHNAFAYPNGNYDRRILEAVQNTGYKTVFLFNHEIARNPVNPLSISRLCVSDVTPIWKYKLILFGFHSMQLKWRKALNL